MAKPKSLSDKLANFFTTPVGQFAALLLVVLASHFPLLVVRQIENPDAGMIYDNLESLRFPFEYFRALIDFRTYDFQPVRDMTLYFDIWVFQNTGLVISVLLNSFLWAGACYLVLKILRNELGVAPSNRLLFLVCCFAIYPIFQGSVNWGIARKHLLAFFFILSATNSLLEWEKGQRGLLPIVFHYVLSVLSLPISICWPLWVFCRLGGSRTLRDPQKRDLILYLGVLSVVLAAINFAYYKTSYTFLETYTRKASGFDYHLIPQNLGLLFRQMLFPYKLSIFYNYDLSTLYFFGVFLAFVAFVIYLARKIPKIWMWPLFGLLPVLVVLTTPQTYFDTYVIVPTFALFMFIMTTWPSRPTSWSKLALVPFLIWFGFTWQSHALWDDPIQSYKSGFAVSPNCTNARSLGYRYYKSGKKLPNDLFDFIQVNECLEVNKDLPPNLALKIIGFEAMLLFYEDEIDRDYRKERLQNLGQRNLFPFIVYAAFLAQTGEAVELEALMREQNEILKNSPMTFSYESILAEHVPDFCQRHKLQECLAYLKRWRDKPKPQPYF